jgi:hypothetical protein
MSDIGADSDMEETDHESGDWVVWHGMFFGSVYKLECLKQFDFALTIMYVQVKGPL